MMSKVKVTPELLDEMHRKAINAGRVLWATLRQPQVAHIIPSGRGLGHSLASLYGPKRTDYAEHIAAASPAVVLALVQRIRELESALETDREQEGR